MKKTNESGFVLIVTALMIFVLIAFLALAIDIGIAYAARTQAQAGADAGALAGAFSYRVDDLSSEPTAAIGQAKAVANQNRIIGKTPDSVSVDFPAANLIRVTVDHRQDTFFAKVLSIAHIDVKTEGIAEIPSRPTHGPVKPWFIPNTILDQVNGPSAASAAGNVMLQKTGSGYATTSYAALRYGQQILLKPGDRSNALTSGQFFEIQFPGDTGGNDYRNDIATDRVSADCLKTYDVLTGNKQGETKQGVDLLIGNPPDTYVGIGRYSDGSTEHNVSRSLVLVPIWEPCSLQGFCPTDTFPSGSNTQLQTIGFALVFVDGVSLKGDVTAHLINVAGCNLDTSTDPQGATAYGLPIRLVRAE